MLFLSHPEDAETVYRNEGKYPFRGDPFVAVKKWRNSHPGNTIVLYEIKNWQKKVNKGTSDDSPFVFFSVVSLQFKTTFYIVSIVQVISLIMSSVIFLNFLHSCLGSFASNM